MKRLTESELRYTATKLIQPILDDFSAQIAEVKAQLRLMTEQNKSLADRMDQLQKIVSVNTRRVEKAQERVLKRAAEMERNHG